jgi:hypothetical protein
LETPWAEIAEVIGLPLVAESRRNGKIEGSRLDPEPVFRGAPAADGSLAIGGADAVK